MVFCVLYLLLTAFLSVSGTFVALSRLSYSLPCLSVFLERERERGVSESE